MLDLLDEDISAGLIPTRAISLTQPWCYFMLSLPPEHLKRIENRSWNSAVRGPVWVHASKKMTRTDFRSACDFALRAGVPVSLLPSSSDSRLIPRGGIVGRFTITDVILPGGLGLRSRAVEIAGGMAPLHPRRSDRWYMGQYGYVVENAMPVPFCACSGALGFWRVPHPVLRKLLEASR